MKFNPFINSAPYAYSEEHKLINFSDFRANIGEGGENLSIVVLSYNRSVLTIQMLESINRFFGEFRGELLVIDNGSTEIEKQNILRTFDKMKYRCRLIELGMNYGVAGGRNRAMSYVQTDWVFSLDNDIYFTSNPLPYIFKTISLTGSHFVNMPLLNEAGNRIFSNGGHLYLHKQDSDIGVGGGSIFAQEEISPNTNLGITMGTFLFGGASVFKKSTFLECGGFDEGMFIGFEDTDFSLRLFQKGYKIGNCGYMCMIHDHKRPETSVDIAYEKERFSNPILKKSADYFEAKHKMKIWNAGVEKWLEEKKVELGIIENVEKKAVINNSSEHAEKESITTEINKCGNSRPKIALVVDSYSWAFANIARQLEKNLSEYFEFKIIYMDIVEHIGRAVLMAKDCDLVHFFWKTHVDNLNSAWCYEYVESMGGSFEEFKAKYLDKMNISTCVYDHLFMSEEHHGYMKSIFNHAANYYVSSNKLKNIYDNIDFIKPPVAVLPDGVDLDLFKPMNMDRFKTLGQRPLVVGWVGNSKWQVEDLKGINTIIKPAVEELQAEGYAIELLTSDRLDQLIPHKKMPEFYSKIDVYVCASSMEGTPNPVLEAMACGVPVISTDVGIVPEVFGELQRGYILEERSKENLKFKLIDLIQNLSGLDSLSDENLVSIKEWDWKVKVEGFSKYFMKCLEKL